MDKCRSEESPGKKLLDNLVERDRAKYEICPAGDLGCQKIIKSAASAGGWKSVEGPRALHNPK